jgi:integrase
MSRPRKPFWNGDAKAYQTSIDKRRVILRHPDGTKVGHGDTRGVREALERLLAERDALIRRGFDPPVVDVCRDYLIAMAAENTEETMTGKEWILAKFCEFGQPPHGERPARDIDSTHLHKMRREWEKAGYAGNMLRRLYREVLACWAWAARPEPERVPLVILPENPLAKMRLPAPSPSRAKYVPMAVVRGLIAFAEQRAERMTPLMAHFERQAVLMLKLLAETGCRPKEACRATWEDFDGAKGLIRLAPGRHKTGRKTGKVRVIGVSPEIAQALLDHRESGMAHPTHLFAHKRSRGELSRGTDAETGAPWARPGYTAWFKRLLRAGIAAGVPDLPPEMTLYWLRGSYLTDVIQGGLGGDAAADLAGNTRVIVRQHYHAAQDDYILDLAEQVRERRG